MNDDRHLSAEELRGTLGELPCFLLYVGWRRAQALYRPVLGSQNPQRIYLLSLLANHEELGVTSIARAMDLDPASASGLISRMESEGLVERSRSQRNRLEVRVRLTDSGRDLYNTVLDDITEIDQKLISGLSAADIDSLRRIVERISQLSEETQAGPDRGDPA